jgi:hypothetical protein
LTPSSAAAREHDRFLEHILPIRTTSGFTVHSNDGVMDPLTALSLAGTIVQFVDFAGKIIRGAKHLYKSTSGALSGNDDLEERTKILSDLATKLKQPIQPPLCGAAAKDASDPSPNPVYAILQDLCDKCGREADQILTRLQGLKVNGKHRAWKSFQLAVKAAWAQREVEEISKRLSDYQKLLEMHVISTIRYASPGETYPEANTD